MFRRASFQNDKPTQQDALNTSNSSAYPSSSLSPDDLPPPPRTGTAGRAWLGNFMRSAADSSPGANHSKNSTGATAVLGEQRITSSNHGSNLSLVSSLGGPPNIHQKGDKDGGPATPRAARSREPLRDVEQSPQSQAYQRSHKKSTASSAFLSISPALAPSGGPTATPTPLTSLYLVSGLPKSPKTWTLADPDSVLGLHHSEGAVGRWWRAEVLGSNFSPGVSGKKKKRSRNESAGSVEGPGPSQGLDTSSKSVGLSKADLGKMLSKALKVCTSIPHSRI